MVHNSIISNIGNHFREGGGIELRGGSNQVYDTNVFYNNKVDLAWGCTACSAYDNCNDICPYERASDYTITNYTHIDPKFVDAANHDFRILSDSPCIDRGTYLTNTINSGTGTSIQVKDAGWFIGPHGSLDSDLIQIGSNKVRMVSVNHTTKVIVVNQNISWSSGDGVSYPYSGSAPDIGTYEYGQTVPPQPADTTPPASPSGLTIIQ